MVAGAFVVVGAGSIGQRHARNLEALGQSVTLIPYRAFDAAALSARSDIAGVVIATATPIRLELIALCASNGWPVYVEKPLAWTREQVAQIYHAAAPIADRSVIGFMMRYHPAIMALAAKDLSDVYRFSFEIGHDVRQWRANWSFADSYASQADGGGVLLDLCHEIDIAHCLFPQLSVTSAASHGHSDFPGVDFATQVHLSDPNGAVGTVAMDYLSPASIRRGGLRGTKASIDLDMLDPTIATDDGTGARDETFTFDRNDMFMDLMRDFVGLATAQTVPDNPLFPRFDKMRTSCDLIADAWAARHFIGDVPVDFS